MEHRRSIFSIAVRAIIILLTASSSCVSSFQLQISSSSTSHIHVVVGTSYSIRHRQNIVSSFPLFESSSSSSVTVDGSDSDSGDDGSSVATKWMANEKRLEAEMDTATAVDSKSNNVNTADKNNNSNNNSVSKDNEEEGPHTVGRWEELHGNYILRPPTNGGQPRALLHFLGGALVGASPQLTYRYLLERLSSNGYLIVATPYQLSFDHLTTCDEIIDKFERVAPMLAREYGAVPVVGVGHSCGALLHVLITSLFPDTPRAANALLSYNNKGVGEAVPFFEELIVPLFSDGERNGSRLMKAMITVTREKYNGRVPSDEALFNLIKELPSPIPGQSINTLLGGLGGLGGGSGEKKNGSSSLLSPSLVSIPKPLRESLTKFLTEPTFDALTNAGVTPLLMQSLDITKTITATIIVFQKITKKRDHTP